MENMEMSKNHSRYNFLIKSIISRIKYIPKKYRNNKDFMIEILKYDGMLLKYASIELRDDFDVVETAVKQHGMSLRYASECLKRNRYIVLNAVKDCGMAIQFAYRFNCDKEIVLEAIKSHAYAFIFINDCFLYDSGDRDIMRTIEQSLYKKHKYDNLIFRF
jgi:serine/threonine-protein kinase TTK/MPS1